MRITSNKYTKYYNQPLMTTPYSDNADGYNQLYTIDDTSNVEQATTLIQGVNNENAMNMQELQLEQAQADATESGITGAATTFAMNKALSGATVAKGAKTATVGAKAGALMKSGFGYGAIAYGVGELIGSQVDDDDPATYTGQEKTADFISHAGQGAMMGSYFGPWGAAIGAVGYGLYGLWKGNKEADKFAEEQEEADEKRREAQMRLKDAQRQLLTVSGSNMGQDEEVALGPGY